MSLGAKKAQYGQFTPPDLQGLRGSNINLLQSLFQGTGQGSPFANLFGSMGSPQNDLQTQSTGAIANFLRQPAPEQRALDTSMPFLQNLLSGNPGQGIIDALKPQFAQNLGQANEQGGRFGSGNAILKSRAVNDFNLLGANALQQGVNQQLQGTNALQLLSSAAGNNPFARMQGAYGVGQQQAGQADLETQRRLQSIFQLLGVGQQSSLGGPTVQTQAASGGLGGFLGQLLGIGAGAAAGGAGAGLGGFLGRKLGGSNMGPATGAPMDYGYGQFG